VVELHILFYKLGDELVTAFIMSCDKGLQLLESYFPILLVDRVPDASILPNKLEQVGELVSLQ